MILDLFCSIDQFVYSYTNTTLYTLVTEKALVCWTLFYSFKIMLALYSAVFMKHLQHALHAHCFSIIDFL